MVMLKMDKILLVNKEKNYTSRDVVNILSNIFNTKKIGHFGTLDPLATGLLVIGIGKYTKLSNLFPEDSKTYVAEALVGVSTDSYDILGKTITQTQVDTLDETLLINTLNSFKGQYLQEVPIFSAVKVNGKKLYEYAREGTSVKLPKKLVNINNIKFLNIYKRNNNLYFSFECDVSKGTYIRSLINDISSKIGIPLCMSNLKRTRQDKFYLKDAYSIDDIKNGNYKLLDITDIFDIDILEIPNNIKNKVINGSLIDYENDKPILFKIKDKNIALYITYKKNNKRSFKCQNKWIRKQRN